MPTVPVALAPMAELSHRALRELIEQFGGCDEYFSEMISAGALINGGPFEKWYVDAGPQPEKMVFQLVGAHINPIVTAAQILNSYHCAGIDLNMGCSAPLIAKTGAGISWMTDKARAAALVRSVRTVVTRRLSVKLRIGIEDDFDYLLDFCRMLIAEGVDRIIVHPRTGKEKFKRRARWEYINRLYAEYSIPLWGNGDIETTADIAQHAPHCCGIMIGRTAVRKPWIFAEYKKIPLNRINKEEIALHYLTLLQQYQPPEFFISRARQFFHYFCDNMQWATYLKNKINRETTGASIIHVITQYFKEHEEERWLN
ncbi:putative tRNA-dihydrouridine synthase B [Pillotina sp. SPG140]|jgi:tRNA-dihydrouridine synthase